MSKFIIVGGFGFIGSHLAKKLIEEGEEVTIIDNSSFLPHPSTTDNYREKNYEFEYRVGALKSGAVILQTELDGRIDIGSLEPDYVIYAAGPSLPGEINHSPYRGLEEMVGQILYCVDLLVRNIKIKNFVYLSSSMVYGNFEEVPIREDHSTNPIELYGTYKLTAENVIRSYHHKYKLPYTNLRLSGVYGPGDGNGRVLETLLDNAVKGRDLIVRNSIVDFTYIDDVVDGILQATLAAKNDTFNLSRGEGRKISSAAEFITESLAFGTKITYEPEEEWRPIRGTLDISKAKKAFQYYPKYPLEMGLKIYHDHIQKRAESI